MKRLILVFFILIFVTACSRDQVPEGVIENGKMISVLTDVHLVEAFVSSAAYDTTTQPVANYYKVLYNKHQIDSVQLQKSLRYYSSKPELLDTMYHQVLKRLDIMERNENLQEQKRTQAQEILRIHKENAAIRLKPQPHWLFKSDTAGLFDKTPLLLKPPSI